MENKKRKKKFSWKRLKKIFKNLGKLFKEEFLEMVNSFKKSSKQFKMLICVWVVVILIVIFLLVVCNQNNKKIATHQKIENAVVIAAQEYVKEYQLYSASNQKLMLDINVLLEQGMLDKKDVTDDTCEGYASVYWDEEKEDYVINAYLACKGYVTDGYNDNKE